MSCKVINKDFNLFSCNKEDIESEWMHTDCVDYNINTLAIFYNPQTDKLILVEDARHFEKLKLIAEEYLTFSCEQRDDFHNNHIPESMVGFMNVLKGTVDIREEIKKKDKEFQSLKEILGHQYGLPWSEIEIIFRLYDSHKPGNKSLGLINIYNYGVIQGKRAERAKKKKLHVEVTV